jgi:hypothetical protein
MKYKKLHVFAFLILIIILGNTTIAQEINPDDYPACEEKEWGQLLWVMKLGAQPIDDFTHFQCVDEQGVSADRYTLGFSGYFLGAEQYHKFPAWRGQIQETYDRVIRKMIRKPVWEYWSKESPGVTKFEPGGNRPYAPQTDPIAVRNIMYSGHLGMMINQYQVLYNDLKWDEPGSIVLQWDDKTRYVYDNKSLQFAMFNQFITNPVPGIECEPNAIFSACNQMPLLSWWYYDYLHGSRFFQASQPLFSNWFKKVFINPETYGLAGFYLVKQGWVFAQWNPKYGNAFDVVIQGLIEKGANFYSPGNDGWTLTYMHAYDKKYVEELWPYLKKMHVTVHPDGLATINAPDALMPDADYGFFATLAAEVGDEEVKNGLLKYADSLFLPVWEDGTYHYPFMDKTATLNLAADGGAKPAEATPVVIHPQQEDGKGGQCCKRFNKMSNTPQHSDVSDRTLALARALPKNGMYLMYNKPFDKTHFIEPAITDVDLSKLILKRAIYDRGNKILIVSTTGKKDGGSASFKVINLDPAKTYSIEIDKMHHMDLVNKPDHIITIDADKAHDIIVKEK